MEPKRLPLLTWSIACFDKRKENPWPPVQRHHWLDWSRATAEEMAAKQAVAPIRRPSGKGRPRGRLNAQPQSCATIKRFGKYAYCERHSR
jgi:hypothetical protein